MTTATENTYETILVERRGRVGVITLNRPEALNALNAQLMEEVVSVAQELDRDREIGCIVITGSERAFAAGADIKMMAGQEFVDVYVSDFFRRWDDFAAVRTPIVAAVSGFALGGGCELAMMCDVILAGDNAKFGQPEVNLGVIPGLGGTQRLTRLIGQAKAMELNLTGRFIGAEEAERIGLVSRIVPAADLLDDAIKTATLIASKSLPVTIMIKESVKRAAESSLAEGLLFERRTFFSTFATDDQTEGMAAFVEKREAEFSHR
ncbi:MAG: echA8 1 [Thermoleophilia bacterium]|jgi:enoyl-CoA hydratase|nr:echA8 1 [Thermoleophilia bacterium]